MPYLADAPPFFALIFPWPLMAVGIALSYSALRALMAAQRSRQWPTVQGTVTLTSMDVTDTGGDYPHDVFTPVIEYRYAVDGVQRTSRKLALVGLNPAGKADAEAVLARYKVGKPVQVYYSPDDPALAILEPGIRWPTLGKLAAGVCFFLAGVVLFVVFGVLN